MLIIVIVVVHLIAFTDSLICKFQMPNDL